HSREYVPVLAYSPRLPGGVNRGTRRSLADIGQTIAENFGVQGSFGTSFLPELTNQN
ncbi:MAG: phosphopentomutase, partial [Candidatus Acidiferrales bacterium]